MEFSFKKLGEALANFFSGNPEMKAHQTEFTEAMQADAASASSQFSALSVKVDELTAQIAVLNGEKSDLAAAVAQKDTELVALKADADKYSAIKEEYETLKAFDDNRKNALGIVGEDGGQKAGGGLSDAAKAKKDEIERLKAEYPDLVKGLL